MVLRSFRLAFIVGLMAATGTASYAQYCALGTNIAAPGNSHAFDPFSNSVEVVSTPEDAITLAEDSGYTIHNVRGFRRSFGPKTYLFTSNAKPYVLTYTFTPPIEANRIALAIHDVGNGAAGGYTPTLTMSITGTATTEDFVFSALDNQAGDPYDPLTYTPATGVFSKTTPDKSRESGAVVGNSTRLIASLSITSNGFLKGDWVRFALPSLPTCITTQKISAGSTGTFNFDSSNVDAARSAITTSAINVPADNQRTFLYDQTVPVTITELAPTSTGAWRLAKASCIDRNDHETGNLGRFGILRGKSLTIPQERLTPSSDLLCTFVNSLLVAANDKVRTPMNEAITGPQSIFTNDTGTGISLVSLNAKACQSFPCQASVTGGNIAVDQKGFFTFAPTTDFFGSVVVPYVIKDKLGLTAYAYILIDVRPIPDPGQDPDPGPDPEPGPGPEQPPDEIDVTQLPLNSLMLWMLMTLGLGVLGGLVKKKNAAPTKSNRIS